MTEVSKSVKCIIAVATVGVDAAAWPDRALATRPLVFVSSEKTGPVKSMQNGDGIGRGRQGAKQRTQHLIDDIDGAAAGCWLRQIPGIARWGVRVCSHNLSFPFSIYLDTVGVTGSIPVAPTSKGQIE